MNPHVSLTDMEPGQEGVVVNVQGGFGIVQRLDAMGIRRGAKLVKVSKIYLRGPVTVRIGNAQIAVGHGMAGRIILEICKEAT